MQKQSASSIAFTPAACNTCFSLRMSGPTVWIYSRMCMHVRVHMAVWRLAILAVGLPKRPRHHLSHAEENKKHTVTCNKFVWAHLFPWLSLPLFIGSLHMNHIISAVALFRILHNVFTLSHACKSKALIAALFSLLQVHYPPAALSLYTVLGRALRWPVSLLSACVPLYWQSGCIRQAHHCAGTKWAGQTFPAMTYSSSRCTRDIAT